MKPIADLLKLHAAAARLETEVDQLAKLQDRRTDIADRIGRTEAEIARLRAALQEAGYDPDSLPAEQPAA